MQDDAHYAIMAKVFNSYTATYTSDTESAMRRLGSAIFTAEKYKDDKTRSVNSFIDLKQKEKELDAIFRLYHIVSKVYINRAEYESQGLYHILYLISIIYSAHVHPVTIDLNSVQNNTYIGGGTVEFVTCVLTILDYILGTERGISFDKKNYINYIKIESVRTEDGGDRLKALAFIYEGEKDLSERYKSDSAFSTSLESIGTGGPGFKAKYIKYIVVDRIGGKIHFMSLQGKQKKVILSLR